jgi:hypothetical protein
MMRENKNKRDDKMKKTQNEKVTLQIKRPNGRVETVDVTAKFKSMNDRLFANIKQATEKAGRGEVLSYDFAPAKWEMEESDYITHCARCSKEIDSRSAHTQDGLHGEKRVVDHYCDICKKVLASVGDGEHSELES